MNEVKINSFVHYISYIEENYTRDHIFRGLHNVEHLLIPKIGRTSYTSQFKDEDVVDALQDMEEKTMQEFIKMSVPHMDLRTLDPWEQWTIGQHHGLPTRFLDWTENPLIAAYFATENVKDNDVAVYVVDKNQFNTNTAEYPDVYSFEDAVVVYSPSYIHPRIEAQKGVFTVHKNPTIPLHEIEIDGEPCKIDKLIIPKEIVKDFINDLDWMGINRSFIYPGLDGLAYHLDYKARGGI